VLAALIVGVAFLTGGNLFRALVIAVAFFVLATAWSWSRWRKQLTEAQAGQSGRPGVRP
jgi:membrane protein implicated in regulation of membrane protease activity